MKFIAFCGLKNREHKTALRDILLNAQGVTYCEESNTIPSIEQLRGSSSETPSCVAFIFNGNTEELNLLEMGEGLKCVGFYTRPELFVSESANGSTATVEALLNIWKCDTSVMLEHYLSNSDNTVLLEESSAFENVAEFLNCINQSFGTELSSGVEEQKSVPDNTLKALHKLTWLQKIRKNKDVQNLYEQLESAAELRDSSTDLDVAQRESNYLKELQSEIAYLQQSSKQEIERLKVEQSDLEALIAKLESEKKQIQEESQKQQSKAEQENQELLKEKESLTSRNSELEAERNSLKSHTAQLESERDELKSENELALLQINQLQEELEATYLANQDNIKEKESLTTRNSELEAERNALQSRTAQLDSEQSELKSENELSMLQILQLQEELEFYYIKFQQGGVWAPMEMKSSDFFHLERSLNLLSI